MTFKWQHWFVTCRQRACHWHTSYFPPDQKWDKELEDEIKKGRCPECNCLLNVRWNGEKTKNQT